MLSASLHLLWLLLFLLPCSFLFQKKPWQNKNKIRREEKDVTQKRERRDSECDCARNRVWWGWCLCVCEEERENEKKSKECSVSLLLKGLIERTNACEGQRPFFYVYYNALPFSFLFIFFSLFSFCFLVTNFTNGNISYLLNSLQNCYLNCYLIHCETHFLCFMVLLIVNQFVYLKQWFSISFVVSLG